MTPQTTLPPRTAYNQAIAAAWYLEHGIVPGVPPLSRQVTLMPLKTVGLHQHGYNPSLFPLRYPNGQPNGAYLLSYRHHPNPTQPATHLTIAQIDREFNVVKNHNLALDGMSQEDARFFWRQSAIWLSWVESTFHGNPIAKLTSVIKYGRLDTSDANHWKIVDIAQPAIGKNDGSTMEKNWVFFEHKRALRVIYETSPETLILNLDGSVYKRFKSPRWMYGHMRGGAAPVPYLGHWLRFVHSALDNEAAPERRRYYVGAVLYDKETLAPIGHTREPLMRGSERDDLTDTARAACPHWKAKVVFPSGACEVDGGFLVSVGVNDSAAAIVKLTPQQLSL